MSNQSGFDRLLAEFGAHIGIPQLVFDQEGMCNFLINENTPLTLRRDDDRQQLIIITCLLDGVPDPLSREWTLAMLELALQPMKGDQPGIGLEPRSGLLMLYRLMPLAVLTEPVLEAAIASLMEMHAKLTKGGATPSATADQSSEPASKSTPIFVDPA